MKPIINSCYTFLLILILGSVSFLAKATTPVLDENCVINILNRTVQVNKDGGWSMPNVPSQLGRIRARATCTRLGETFSGESDYFNIVRNSVVQVPEIKFANIEPVPVSLQITEPTAETLAGNGASLQLKVLAKYRDGTELDVTTSDKGTNYTSSNSAIASVNTDGLITSVGSGSVLITARKDEVVAFKRLTAVSSNGDSDNDGIPDDYELANGLNPNDPIDAQEDFDQDGLTNLQEYKLGTGIRKADTDGDGIPDGVEVSGTDGFKTDPLKADTDGDGVSDFAEIKAGFDPTNKADGGGRSFTELLITPANPSLTFNTVYNEASLQIKVTGKRGDGSQEDLTSRASGTSYMSSNPIILNFGGKDGLVFAGQPGTASLTVRNGDLEKTVTVKVDSFSPTALSAISIPGYANNVDVAGVYAYVAAGSKGLQIVNVSNHASPVIVGSLDTPGIAIDVRVVGSVVYLADGDHGLQIIDVTNPAKPILLASYETAGIAQDIKVDNQFIYIADGDGGLEIVDIHQPERPLAAGSLTGLGDVKGVDAQDNRAVMVVGNSLYSLDVSDKTNPFIVGSLGIGEVKDVALKDNYAFIAAYTSGFKVVDLTNPATPAIKMQDFSFFPFDVELTDGFAFLAEVYWVNASPYVNIEDPANAVFQGVLDFSRFNDYNGTGIALDSNYVYLTASNAIADYQADGSSTLLIGQYRLIEDQGGIPPTIQITEPAQNTLVIEGKKITVTANADDDIGVASVSFLVNGELAYTDTTRPYQYPVNIPVGQAPTRLNIVAEAVDFGGNTQSTPSISIEVQADSDHDGLGDGQEQQIGTNPDNPDTDGDGLLDGDEVDRKTNPLKADTDNDGFDDGTEVKNDTDPLDPDTTPPSVIAFMPDIDTANVPETSQIVIKFSEKLRAKSISAQSVIVYQGLYEGSPIVAGKIRLSDDGLQLIFIPGNLLADYTDYQVLVDHIRDHAGNLIANPNLFHFKTGNTQDITPPIVTSMEPCPNFPDSGANVVVTPANQTINCTDNTTVPVNSVIGVRFSEPVDVKTLNDQNIKLFDATSQKQIPGSINLRADGQSFIFVANEALQGNHQYQLDLTAGIKDLFGNPLGLWLFNFETSSKKDETAPSIVDINVTPDQTNVPGFIQLQIQFDERLSSLNLGGVELRKGEIKIAVTPSLSVDHKTLILKLAQPLLANTTYTLDVKAVQDMSGNVLAHELQRNFTTMVSYAPSIDSIQPKEALSGSFITDLTVNGKLLGNATFRFSPAKGIKINSTSIASDGNSAHLNISFNPGVSGVFTLIASTPDGSSSDTPTASNSLTVYNLNPDTDTDGDGLTNAQEIAQGTNPDNIDTDNDGFSDGLEVTLGSNPLDSNSRPSLQTSYIATTNFVFSVLNEVNPQVVYPVETPMATTNFVFSVLNEVNPQVVYPVETPMATTNFVFSVLNEVNPQVVYPVETPMATTNFVFSVLNEVNPQVVYPVETPMATTNFVFSVLNEVNPQEVYPVETTMATTNFVFSILNEVNPAITLPADSVIAVSSQQISILNDPSQAVAFSLQTTVVQPAAVSSQMLLPALPILNNPQPNLQDMLPQPKTITFNTSTVIKPEVKTHVRKNKARKKPRK